MSGTPYIAVTKGNCRTKFSHTEKPNSVPADFNGEAAVARRLSAAARAFKAKAIAR
jgi:hypothetical protein